MDFKVLHCLKCRGAWFSYHAVVVQLGHVVKPDRRAPEAATRMRCPEDGAALLQTTHRRGHEIQVCSRCGGVWLDHGEFERMTARVQPNYGPGNADGVGAHAAAAARRTVADVAVSRATEQWPETPALEESDGRDETLEDLRDSLRNPRLSHVLLLPLLMLFGLPLIYGITATIGGKIGLSPEIVAGIACALLAAITGRRALTRAEIEEEVRAHEATLNVPLLAALLGKGETLLFLVLAIILGPGIGGWLLGPDHGEVGFGGIVFLLAGLWIALVGAVTALWFQSGYLQDRYWLRVPLDAAAVWLLLHIVLPQAPGPVKPTGETELHDSVRAGDVTTVKTLDQKNMLENRNSLGQTPLMLAVEQEAARANPARVELVRELLAKGAAVDARDQDGRTPYLAAVKHAANGGTEVVRLLLEHGADVNARDKDRKPAIFFAVHNPVLLNLLLAHGADPHVTDGGCGSIWTQMLSDPPEAIIAVADKVREIRTPGTVQNRAASPLLLFAYRRKPPEFVPLIRYFLQRGLDPNQSSGCLAATPLHAVIGSDYPAERIEAIDLLLAAGADIDVRDSDRETPLMVSGSNPELTRHLIGRGADINAIAEKYWKSALDIVEGYGHAEAAMVLRAAGARPGTDFTSPQQRKAVKEAVEHGAEPTLQACSAGFAPCGEVVEEHPVDTPVGRAIRKRFRYQTLEITALFPVKERYRYIVEELVVSGSTWRVPEGLHVGSERKYVQYRLGPPTSGSADGCSSYRPDRTENEIKFCFGAGDAKDQIVQVRWRFVPDWSRY